MVFFHWIRQSVPSVDRGRRCCRLLRGRGGRVQRRQEMVMYDSCFGSGSVPAEYVQVFLCLVCCTTVVVDAIHADIYFKSAVGLHRVFFFIYIYKTK